MKVICDRAALLEAVNLVTSVVPSRGPSPVLQCVKLRAADGLLTLAATDAEVGLRLGIEQVDVEDPGEALIPADKFAQIVRSSDDATLTLETDEHKMRIKGADALFTIYGFDPADAPRVRGEDLLADELPIDSTAPAGVIHTLVHRTLFAASAEHSKYAINGVLMNRDGKKLRLVSTDGRRLAVARGTATTGEGSQDCIIPTKALRLIIKIARDPDAPVRIVVEDNQVLFAIGDGPGAAVLSSNLVEGTFPPFEDVIPKDQDKKVTSNVDALTSAIRRAALLTAADSKGVRMHFEEGRLELTSRAPEMGEAKVEVELKYEGSPVDIGFNPTYIIDALGVIDDGEVTIELKAENKPGVLRSGPDFTYVVMPLSL